MANLSSEQEELLREIKSTFGSEPAKKEDTAESTKAEVNENKKVEDNEADSSNDITEAGIDEIKDNTEAKDSFDDLDLENEFDTPVKVTAHKSMPKYGPGFKYVPIISIITVIAVVIGHIGPIANGIPSNKILRYIYIGIGVLILIWGFSLIANAISECAILLNAPMGKLVTTGVYSKTRNPMYVGVTFICTAALFISGNAFMYFLPIVFWLLHGFIVAETEEKMLERLFGQDYLDYKNVTYRFMPIKKRS